MSRQSHIFGLDDHFFVNLPASSSFPFSIWNQKSCFAKPRRGFKADLLFRQRSYVWLREFCFLINTLPVLVDYLGSDQCFCHIELGGRAWKCLLCNLGRTSRRTSQCLCDASRWDTPARRPSKSPRLPLDLQLSWKSFKLVSRQLESPFSTVRGWMDENQALLFWCLASIIRIVWRTTDSCCVSWYYGISKNLSMLDISARSKKSWQTIPWWWRGVGIFWF